MPDNYENIRTHVIDESPCCHQCEELFAGISRPFIVCKTCGNKRCPKATDHRNACTGSNEPGQPGSAYGGLEPGRIVPRYEQIWIARSDYNELEKRCDDLESDRKRFEELYIESRSEHLDAELHAGNLERQLLDLTAERDRFRRWQHESNDRQRVYRREIRRLQRALLAERGKGVTDELERQSRVLAGLQARLEALEGKEMKA